jgi:ABC-2 type transport system ATP-binding protein
MIEVTNLTKVYGNRTAVSDISFTIQKGEVVGFLGPNGAGKSTTMKILTCFMPATSGEAKVAGFDVFDDPIEVKRRMGYLPETPPVYTEMRVRDYLDFTARLHQVPAQKRKSAVSTAIEKTGLKDVSGRLIQNLSKGFRQRVGIAQAILHNPDVLILDEPTVGLDPKQIIEIRDLIKSLAGDHTVILSSHILPEITATCQRVIVINKGKIVAKDSIESLTTKMRRGHGASFLLVVRNPSQDGMTALKSIPGVSQFVSDGNKITFELATGKEDIRDQIVETAVQKKMGVLEFSAEKVSLEDVFLQLTTQEGSA